MPEVNMRRIGLKLVFAAALTLFLVTSVRQQWKSTKQKLTREMTSDDQPDSHSNDNRNEESEPMKDELAVGGKTERLDPGLEGDSLETKAVDKNSENVSAIESDRHGDDFGEEIEVHDDESLYEPGINISNGVDTNLGDESPISTHSPLSENTVANSPQAAGKNEVDSPVDEDSDDHDPPLRASKYQHALYDDEEDEDSYKEDDSQVSDTDAKQNDIADDSTKEAFSDLTQPGNTGTKESSMFSWLGLGKYLFFGNSPGARGQDESGIYNNDKNTFDLKSIENGESSLTPDLSVNTSFLTDNEGINTGIDNTTGTEITDVNEQELDINQNFGYSVQKHQDDAQNVQVVTDDKAPFDINGIDEANYDDFDDNDYQEPKGDVTELEHQTDNSQVGISKDTPSLRVASLEGSDTAGLEVLDGLHPWEQERQTIYMGATQAQRPNDGLYIPQGTRSYPQHIQRLLYQQQQRPLLPQLTQQRLQLFRAFLPPRIVDLMLSENLDVSYLSQLPAKLQYYIQQNIHRIDPDFYPLSNNETKYTAGGQTQLPASPTLKENERLSLTFPLTSTNNDKTEHPDNFEAKDIAKSITYEVDNHDSGDNIYESDNYNNNDYSNDDADVAKDQDKMYTPPPDIANYDNPRPLLEREFALYRTQPYNTNTITTQYVSTSLADVKYIPNNDDVDGIGLPAQQLDKSWTRQEDETLSCPREIGLAKMPHPVTALVAFSDDSTVWVRRILEQLTGTETDSIYNIMAHLKAGNSANVYQMGNKIAIETHIASDKNFHRALVVIRNPFAVDAQHKAFRPASVDWQKSILWNHTYSTWLTSNLPLHVTTYEDLVERPLTELMKLIAFVSSPEMKISYKCAMRIALDPPNVIDDISQITGIYQDDRRRINQNIDYLIKVAQKTYPEIVYRLNSYKLLSSFQNEM